MQLFHNAEPPELWVGHSFLEGRSGPVLGLAVLIANTIAREARGPRRKPRETCRSTCFDPAERAGPKSPPACWKAGWHPTASAMGRRVVGTGGEREMCTPDQYCMYCCTHLDSYRLQRCLNDVADERR